VFNLQAQRMTKPSLMFRVRSATRAGFKIHGIRFPFVLLHRTWVYLCRKFIVPPRKFVFAGKKHAYVVHPFILDNERTVEVAIANEFLRGKTGKILEVGNVLTNFFPFPHDVVDKYEKAPGVINEDIVTYAPCKKYDYIVTISTLEHVGWDEQPREPEKILRAINHLKELLAPGGQLLATMPLGYNCFVDRIVRENKTGFSEIRYLLRVSANNQWREARLKEVVDAKFGSPFSCANAIVVGYFRKNGST
jgi:SAM-dependent methyltransferase